MGYDSPWAESANKVVIVHQLEPCSNQQTLSHHVDEPVPHQLAGRLTQAEWTAFLTDVWRVMPENGLVPVAGSLILLIIFFVAMAYVGYAAFPIFLVLVLFLAAWNLWFKSKLVAAFNGIVERHRNSFHAKGIRIVFRQQTTRRGKRSRTHYWLELHVDPLPGLAPGVVVQGSMTLRVTVPPGVAPGQQLVIAAPDGRQVTAIVPLNAPTGSQFDILIPAASPEPVIQAPVIFPDHQQPSTLTFGKKTLTVTQGVPVDTTGDGHTDSVGYDTTGDGRVDAVDTTGDGKINMVTGPSAASVGDLVAPTTGTGRPALV